MKIELKCRFCPTVCGEIDLPDNVHIEEGLGVEALGVADVRCDECTVKYGRYNDTNPPEADLTPAEKEDN